MTIRSFLTKMVANHVVARTKKCSSNPIPYQQRILFHLIKKGKQTHFGKDHDLGSVVNYEGFKEKVPIRDYEGLHPYMQNVVQGQLDVLWPGRPIYLAKTSGTTSGVKYIPITKDSISNHINGARDALLSYVHETGKYSFLDKKWIFLSGSPALDTKGKIKVGRLSGIVNHHVPSYLRSHQMPSYTTNCIEDWEQKLDKIVDETLEQDMGLISGIPPWVQMYFDRIEAKTGSKVKHVFPNLSLFVHGGVNFEPYSARLLESMGKRVDSIELYPASEGFIAYQDSQHEEGMLLLLNSGIFFEFIPVEEFFDEKPTRINIADVEIGKHYALIINSNAGLWGYSIGDTIKFVSTTPHRIVVSGRIKHFISAFGEHVISEEVDKAMKAAMECFPEVEVVEFTVAPRVTPHTGLPHHEWLVEFAHPPYNLDAFSIKLDEYMCMLNIYYNDLISGGVLRTLKIVLLKKNTFTEFMKSLGRLGGQNKVSRLSNDRLIADELIKFGDL